MENLAIREIWASNSAGRTRWRIFSNAPPRRHFKRIQGTAEFSEEPLNAVLQGVDDAWEVSLLKFTMDLIQQSAPGNMGDFRKRGLL